MDFSLFFPTKQQMICSSSLKKTRLASKEGVKLLQFFLRISNYLNMTTRVVCRLIIRYTKANKSSYFIAVVNQCFRKQAKEGIRNVVISAIFPFFLLILFLLRPFFSRAPRKIVIRKKEKRRQKIFLFRLEVYCQKEKIISESIFVSIILISSPAKAEISSFCYAQK